MEEAELQEKEDAMREARRRAERQNKEDAERQAREHQATEDRVSQDAEQSQREQSQREEPEKKAQGWEEDVYAVPSPDSYKESCLSTVRETDSDEEGEEPMTCDEDELFPDFPIHEEYDHNQSQEANFNTMSIFIYNVLTYYAAHSRTSVDTVLDRIIAHRLSNSRATNPYNMYLAMRREDPGEKERLRALGISTEGMFFMNFSWSLSDVSS